MTVGSFIFGPSSRTNEMFLKPRENVPPKIDCEAIATNMVLASSIMSATGKQVYLCGPISGTTYETCAKGWREKVHNDLAQAGIDSYSPMRGKAFLAKEGRMSPHSYDESAISSTQGILGRDRNDTIRADLIFCNLLGADRVSIGSMVELGWADIHRIPIIVCMEKGNVHDHLFVKGLATYLVDNLDEGVALAKMLLTPGL